MALTKPFAENGDKKTIPENTTGDGSLSYETGFGGFYALPPEEGGLYIDRAQFNQLMFDTTSQVLENKQALSNLSGSTYNKTEVDNLLGVKANWNAVVNLTGNQTIEGIKTFSSVPVSATQPTNANQVANKAYVDSVGNTAVKLTGNQTIAGTKTFSSPVVVPDATATTHAVNLAQLNTKANWNAVVNLTGNQTIEGIKTFSSIPVSATKPTNANQVANKAYVDSVGNTKANANAVVNLTGNQTIAGTKTFSSPIVVPNGTANTHAVNLSQLNTKANANATVNLNGNQTIAGVKTFSSVPVCATAPTNANQLANKAYVDGLKQVPDYSAAISITPNKAFTPNFNGVVEVYCDFTNNNGFSINLGNTHNKQNVILGVSASGIASGFGGGQAIIVKGQTYFFNASIQTLYRAIICPFKGVN